MSTALPWILSILGVILLIVARHEIARAWAPGTRLQAGAALALTAGGVLSQVGFVGNPLAVRLLTAAFFIILCVLSVLQGRGTTGVRGSAAPVVVAFVLWLWLFAVDLVAVFADAGTELFGRALPGAVLLVFFLAQVRKPLLLHHFTAAALVVLAALLITLPAVPDPVGSCTDFKCSELGAILLGPFPSGNYFGLMIAMTGALALATVTSVRALLGIGAICAIALYATNARTSLLALAAGLVVFGAMTLVQRHRRIARGPRMHTVLAVAVATLVPALGLYLIFTASLDTLSNRGRVWILAVDAIGGKMLTGLGLDRWSVLQESGDVSFHFAHSQYMAILFSGGFVGIALFALFLGVSVATGTKFQATWARGIVVPLVFAVLGLAEVVWNPLTVDGLTWHAAAVCCVAAVAAGSTGAAARLVPGAAQAGPVAGRTAPPPHGP